jgi:hypothetical protein
VPVIAGQYAVKIVISTITIPLVSVAVIVGRRFVMGDAQQGSGAPGIVAEEASAL